MIQNGSIPLCVSGAQAPREPTATYDEATDTLTLTWAAPDTETTPDSYNVYRDDVRIGDTTDLEYDDSLTNVHGVHFYYIKAVTGTTESIQSDSVWLAKGVTAPGVPCDPLVVDVYTYPPYFAYGIRDECLP